MPKCDQQTDVITLGLGSLEYNITAAQLCILLIVNSVDSVVVSRDHCVVVRLKKTWTVF